MSGLTSGPVLRILASSGFCVKEPTLLLLFWKRRMPHDKPGILLGEKPSNALGPLRGTWLSSDFFVAEPMLWLLFWK
jgi:hypothetical protein